MPGGSQFKKRPLCERARGFTLLLAFLLSYILFFFILDPLNAQAGEISIGTEFNYTNSTIETTNKNTGNVTGSDFTSFDQNYNIGLSRNLYPFLTFNAGSSFELDDSLATSDELSISRKAENISPYIDIALRSPLYAAGIGYSKTQFKNELTGAPVRKNLQESLDFSFVYRPAGLPLLKIFHNRAHSYNDPRTTDTVSTQTTAKVSHNVKGNPVSYTYRRGETTDRLTDLNVISESHVGNASYSRGLFNDRFFMDAGYRIQYDITTVPGTGGSIDIPLSPHRGLFFADDTHPLFGGLNVFMDLIQPDVPAGGINIGWDAFIKPAVGLDFGFPLSVDRLLIYVGDVDRNALLSVSHLFEWHVYTSSKLDEDISDSATTWQEVLPVSASIDAFQNRFEISFPEVSTRYIKVVITPLPKTPETIGEPDLKDISVTEIEASMTAIVSSDQRTTGSRHNISFNLAGRLSDKTRIGYNFQFSQTNTDTVPSVERYSLSNSIYVNHIINRIFAASARVSQDQNKSTTMNVTTRKSVGYGYSANLRAAYLETFSQTLTLGYRDIEEERGKLSSGSVFLRTSAALYKGWDAFIDVGYTWSNSPDAGRTTSTFLTTQTSVVPNKKISFDATYTIITTEIKEEATTNIRQGYDLRASYFPYPNLSLSSQISVETQSQQDSKQVLQRYAASWSPLRGGDLQLLLSYSETRRPTDDQKDTNVGPVVKWAINNYASLNVGYFYTTVDTLLEKKELSTLTAKLGMTF